MSILAAYAVPHPPLIIPEIGKGEEKTIQRTIDAYREISRRVVAHRPETLIISSPHAPFYRAANFIATCEVSRGSMVRFGMLNSEISAVHDVELTQAIIKRAKMTEVPVIGDAAPCFDMDHAAYIPMHFINNEYGDRHDYRVVAIGLSCASPKEHFRLGQVVSECAESLNRRCVYLASGDLSHRLKESGPYGFSPDGPRFDERVCDLFQSGNLKELLSFDPAMCDSAGECGLRSFQIMAGALNRYRYSSELLSYEGPFGVGYAVAAFEVQEG